MAANSTSVGPGNRLAVLHGAKSEAIVASELPAAVTELRDALAESIPYLQPPDHLLIEEAARIVTQLRLIDRYVDRVGGIIDRRGRPRGCWKLYASLQHQLRETLKMLGVGPAVRAEMLPGLAAGQAASRAQAAQDSLREKYGKEGA